MYGLSFSPILTILWIWCVPLNPHNSITASYGGFMMDEDWVWYIHISLCWRFSILIIYCKMRLGLIDWYFSPADPLSEWQEYSVDQSIGFLPAATMLLSQPIAPVLKYSWYKQGKRAINQSTGNILRNFILNAGPCFITIMCKILFILILC